MENECGTCKYFNGGHACFHPEHKQNVNSWNWCLDWVVGCAKPLDDYSELMENQRITYRGKEYWITRLRHDYDLGKLYLDIEEYKED